VPQAVIVFTTFPSDGDADALAHRLVSERLAACVNILPQMQSIYRWEGAVETASERQLIIKTEQSQLESLKKRLTALHPYDVPEMLVLAVADGGVSYLRWISDSIGPMAPPAP
jgi:periplasmic divalent cation tolerance protein